MHHKHTINKMLLCGLNHCFYKWFFLLSMYAALVAFAQDADGKVTLHHNSYIYKSLTMNAPYCRDSDIFYTNDLHFHVSMRQKRLVLLSLKYLGLQLT